MFSDTIEQTAIFVPVFVAVALRCASEHVFALVFLMGTRCVGHLLFWAGYPVDPAWGAIGMDWTSSVAMITAVWLGSTPL